jgi:hypothetical protein
MRHAHHVGAQTLLGQEDSGRPFLRAHQGRNFHHDMAVAEHRQRDHHEHHDSTHHTAPLFAVTRASAHADAHARS